MAPARTAARTGAGLCLFAALACGGAPDHGEAPEGQGAEGPATDRPAIEAGADTLAPGTYVFTCPDGFAFAASIDPDSARVELVLREDTLPRAPSASGARYAAGDLVFWSHGSEARLEVGSDVYRGCRARAASSPWEKAALLGVELRALGQEPGWILDIHPERWIRYIGDYGETRVVFPPVRPEVEGDTLTFRTGAGGHTLEAVVRRAPCRDAMSGHAFTHTVTVRVGGRELHGCGRRLRDP